MKFKTRKVIFLILIVLALAAVGYGVLQAVWMGIRERQSHHYLRQGYLYSQREDWENTIWNYTKCIQLSPQNTTAHYNRGCAYLQLKEFDEAITDFTEVIRLDPTDPMAIDNRGLAYGKKGDRSNAIIDFTKTIQLLPNDGLVYYHRGYAYALGNHWENAISDYTQAIRRDSTNAMFYHALAFVYSQRRDPINAINNFNEAIRLNPDDADTLNGLAWFLSVYPDASIRDGRKALELGQKACKMTDWRKWYCVGTLAAAYAETGDYTNAVKYQKQAMRLDGGTEKDHLEDQHRLELYQQQQPYHESLTVQKDENSPKQDPLR